MDDLTQSAATRRDWFALAVVCLPCMMYSMDISVLNLAIPKLSSALQPTATELLWIVDIYGFVLAAFLIPMGSLGDRIGRRRLLMFGAAGFGAASILAACSMTAHMLIAARALLGVAAATLAPSTLSLIRHIFHNSTHRTLAIGVWTSSYSFGATIGPVVGGVTLQHFDWNAVFLLSVPVMVVLLLIGAFILPELKGTGKERVDLVSASQSAIATLLVIYSIKKIAVEGWTASSVVAGITGVLVANTFLKRQRHLVSPLIDVTLFRRGRFAMACLAYMMACFVASGMYLQIAQFFQLVRGFTPLISGLWTLPATFGLALGSLLTPQLVRVLPPPVSLRAGLCLAAVGLLILTRTSPTSSLAGISCGLFVLYIGLAPVFITAIDLMIGSVTLERAGEVSALSETASEFGGALGFAILGSVVAFIYRDGVANLIPAEVTANLATVAKDTLGGAVSVAHTLTPDAGRTLFNAAIRAFQSGFHVAGDISAIMLIGMAGLTTAIERQQRLAVVERRQREDTP